MARETIHILCGEDFDPESYDVLRAYECKAKAEAVAKRLERMGWSNGWRHDGYVVNSVSIKRDTAVKGG